DALVVRGADLRLQSPVRAIEEVPGGVRLTTARGTERFDGVIYTLPLPGLSRIAQGGLGQTVPMPELAYQGVVNALVVSRSRLERFYWTAVVEPRFQFHGSVVDTHHSTAG